MGRDRGFRLVAAAKTLAARIGWLVCGAASTTAVLLSGHRTAIFGLILGVVVLVLLGARSLGNGMARLGHHAFAGGAGGGVC
jgi:hypothetical protein